MECSIHGLLFLFLFCNKNWSFICDCIYIGYILLNILYFCHFNLRLYHRIYSKYTHNSSWWYANANTSTISSTEKKSRKNEKTYENHLFWTSVALEFPNLNHILYWFYSSSQTGIFTYFCMNWKTFIFTARLLTKYRKKKSNQRITSKHCLPKHRSLHYSEKCNEINMYLFIIYKISFDFFL